MTRWCDTTEYLQAQAQSNPPTGGSLCEHRLLLSGCAYNGDLLGDPGRSDGGRILLHEPFELLTAALPFSEYPQELALRIKLHDKSRRSDKHTVLYLPNREIVGGLAAILTAYVRRLVTVCGPNAVHAPDGYPVSAILQPLPIPIIARARETTFWRGLPINTITGPEGTTYEDPNPKPVAVSPKDLKAFLLKIGVHPQAKKIVDAARLYHRALELLFSQPDISYLCLVFAADALAHAAFPSVERNEAERLALRVSKNVASAATRLGLPADSVRMLCLEGTESIRHKQRGELFAQFLREFGTGHAGRDMIFNTGDYLSLFKVDDEAAAIDSAYKARSGYVHTATRLRDSALVGTSSRMPVFASMEMFIDDERAPPIIWLERIVAESFLNYVNIAGKK